MADKKNVSKSLERVVAETAMLAGETMLIAGAEISRVEDTMNRILDYSKCESHTAFVLATGITLTLDSDEGLITMSKRVPERTTNINRIYLINNVSRALSAGKMDIYEAYSEIKKIRDVRQFTGILYGLSFVGVALFFTMMLGGDFTDCMVAGVAGLAMAITQWALVPFGFNSFFLKYDLHTVYGFDSGGISKICICKYEYRSGNNRRNNADSTRSYFYHSNERYFKR